MFAMFVSSAMNTSVHIALTANLICGLRSIGLQAGALPAASFAMSLMDLLTSMLVLFFVIGIQQSVVRFTNLCSEKHDIYAKDCPPKLWLR